MATWNLDPSRSRGQFSIRHLMVSTVRGELPGLAARVEWDPASPRDARVEASVEVETIRTGDRERDAYVRGVELFDAARHPRIGFVSTGVAKTSAGLEVRGELTIRDVTREVVLSVKGPTREQRDALGLTRIDASASATIDRRAFGLGWSGAIEAGGVLVGHEARLVLDVSLVRA